MTLTFVEFRRRFPHAPFRHGWILVEARPLVTRREPPTRPVTIAELRRDSVAWRIRGIDMAQHLVNLEAEP